MALVKRIAAASILAALLLGLQAFSPAPSPHRGRSIDAAFAGSTSDSQCYSYRRAEKRFARKINKERAELGLTKLRLDPEVSRVARKHTREMVKADLLHHTSSAVLGRRVTNWTTLGENVGVGGGVLGLHDAFMNSPAHRDNVLYSTYRHVGVGTIKRDGRLWVTVIFEARSNPGTTLWMPKC